MGIPAKVEFFKQTLTFRGHGGMLAFISEPQLMALLRDVLQEKRSVSAQ
jgi:hypothetical protein